MNALLTLELDNAGIVLSVTSSADSKLSNLLPAVGGNITMHWDEDSNNQMKMYLQHLFTQSNGYETTFYLNNLFIECNGMRYKENAAFLLFKIVSNDVVPEQLKFDVEQKKKLEEKLRLIDHSFRTAKLPMLFLTIDGSIYDYNQAICNLLGYSFEEFGKLTNLDFTTTYTSDSWRKRWQDIKAGRTQPFATKLRRKNKTLVDVEASSNTFIYEDTELAFVSFFDITEQVKQQEALKVSEEKYKLLFENTPYPMLIWEFDTLQILDVNRKATQVYGYTKEEFVQLNTKQIRPVEDIPLIEEATKNLETYGVDHHKVWRHLKKNGDIMFMEVSAHVFNYNGKLISINHNQDITQKKLLEEKLEMVDFGFRNISNSMFFMREDGTFLDYNFATHAMLGYTSQEFSKLNLLDINPNYNKETWAKRWKSLLANRYQHVESTLQKKDGTIIDVEVIITIITINNEDISCNFYIDITEKKKQERHLKLKEYIIDNATTAIYLWKKDGTLYDFNKSSYKMLGYTKEEFKNITQTDIDPSYTKEIAEAGWPLLKKEGTLYHTHKIAKKDGTSVHVDITANYIVYDGLELNCAFVTDITEKHKLESKLRLFEYSFRNSPMGKHFIRKDSTVYDYNKKAAQLLGYTEEEYKQLVIWDIMEEQEDGYWVNRWEQYRNSGVLSFERKLKNKKGDWIDMQIDASFIDFENLELLYVTFSDISKRKKEEERLKLLESVILNTKDSILITEAEPYDLPGHRILFVNPAFEKMTGYSAEEVIGQTPRLLQTKETSRQELDKLREALKKWERCEVTVVNERKNGEKFWNNFSMTPVANQNGWFTHWIAVERDVTKEIEAAIEKQKLIDQLIENNKELVQFSYITTHNLRAPLTNLVSICKRIDTNSVYDAQTKKLIEGFKLSTFLLNDTLNDLINILIIKENRKIELQDIDFKDVLEGVKNSIHIMLLNKVVEIETDFTEAPAVYFVRVYLESIFLNLITNSVKYAHPKRHPLIKIKTYREPDGSIKLIFSDNGIGMNMSRVKDKIFRLYQRFHSNADGKGMGLYLVHSQVTALGGRIEVDSEEGIGTTFSIIFK